FHALTGSGEPDEVWAVPVTTNLFSILGVNTIRGRTFAENETQAVVLSYQYWESHFSSDANIIGKAVALDGKSYTVLGVAPGGSDFCAADRWRERGQHAARSWHNTAERDGHPCCAGRRPSEVDPAVGGRKRTSGRCRRSGRPYAGTLGPAHDGQSGAQVQPRLVRDRSSASG